MCRKKKKRSRNSRAKKWTKYRDFVHEDLPDDGVDNSDDIILGVAPSLFDGSKLYSFPVETTQSTSYPDAEVFRQLSNKKRRKIKIDPEPDERQQEIVAASDNTDAVKPIIRKEKGKYSDNIMKMLDSVKNAGGVTSIGPELRKQYEEFLLRTFIPRRGNYNNSRLLFHILCINFIFS
jgi:hypothetical protein